MTRTEILVFPFSKNDITILLFSGRDVTRYLQLLLRKEGQNFHTSAELEIVKTIKEVSTRIASFQAESTFIVSRNNSFSSRRLIVKLLSNLYFFQRACYLSINPQKEETMETEKSSYTLPDGSSLEVSGA